MWKGVQSAKDFLLDTLFPKQCITCSQKDTWLCSDCKKQITFYSPEICIRCYRESQGEGVLCSTCASFYGIADIIPVTDYNDRVVSSSIKYLKYYFIKDLAKDLAQIVGSYIKHYSDHSSLLSKNLSSSQTVFIPVPLHSRKIKRRGFNQANEISKELSLQFNIPVKADLHRIKNKKPQTKLSGSEREKNLKNCFIWKGDDLSLYNIIIIDDVVTTGATMIECASTLKAGGAKNILGLAIAC
jgi:ComF family protein